MPKRKNRIEQVELLKTLVTLSPEKQKNILKFLNNDGVDILCECTHNLLFTDLGLSRRSKRKLKGKIVGKEKLLRFISKNQTNIQVEKRSYFSQAEPWVQF